jgi:5-methylcytosine-specific restriction protein A
MLHAELDGLPFNKAEVNRQLRAGPLSARTEGSIEFRMQNISATLHGLKMPWISGYRPAKNVGSSVNAKLAELLELNGIDLLTSFVPTANPDLLAERVSVLRKRHLAKIPPGSSRPPSVVTSSITFVRDPAIKAWVLENADGLCEGCGSAAPFTGQDGQPYLEVHHVTPLASNGTDRITNAVALCPNCHRRCHYSRDKDEFKLELYERVPRLVLEVSETEGSETGPFIE